MKREKASAMEDLESSLMRMAQEQQQASLRARDRAVLANPSFYRCGNKALEVRSCCGEKAKKVALKTATRVSELLVDTVNGGVEGAFINEKRIEIEIRTMIATVMRYTKQTNQWLTMSHAMNSALKEIGDFENWMKTMEYDCNSVNAALCNIHKA
ncbi:hypothetical protein Taro_031758 [Colocasia esculenta]|uniref:Biogenesis of lysosome-related organelles complex 1 subunit 1 n=1 Tax=Colocasia esculenta TaxID=4460 RepID=A0A843W7D0_COLES|nr:hypothetical protein [Colocasia esculenta]